MSSQCLKALVFFYEGAMFALISGTILFFKVDDSNRSVYEQTGSKRHGLMPYYLVPAEVFKDEAKLLDWARESISIAHSNVGKKERA
ncbi:TfoX family protein [Candidatus Bathyarchaeota archaeon]|nr:MAG: TfoX family protein [Candidatus Bathyarchaeota archaeon]